MDAVTSCTADRYAAQMERYVCGLAAGSPNYSIDSVRQPLPLGAGQVKGMLQKVLWGNQELHGLADEFLGRKAKQRLGCRVNGSDGGSPETGEQDSVRAVRHERLVAG